MKNFSNLSRRSTIRLLKDFIQISNDENINNLYLEDRYIIVYVMKSKRYIHRELLTFLDIGKIMVQEGYEHQGFFTAFVKTAFLLLPWDGIYIECIMNKILLDWCIHNDWKLDPHFSTEVLQGIKSSPSYYMLKTDYNRV